MTKILLLEARLNYSNEYQETVQEFEVTREMPNTLAVSPTYETGFVNDKRISKNQLNEIKGRGTRALFVFITEDQDKQEWFQKMREEIFNRVERHYLEEKARYEAMCKVAGYVEPSVTSEIVDSSVVVDRIKFKAWHKTEKRWATHNELLEEIPVGATVREPSILTVGSDDWELHLIEEEKELKERGI